MGEMTEFKNGQIIRNKDAGNIQIRKQGTVRISLRVGKVSEKGEVSFTDYSYEEVIKIIQNYEKLLSSARLMHFDLIALGAVPYQEMVGMFGMEK